MPARCMVRLSGQRHVLLTCGLYIIMMSVFETCDLTCLIDPRNAAAAGWSRELMHNKSRLTARGVHGAADAAAAATAVVAVHAGTVT